jgi:DnaK suppressor protein
MTAREARGQTASVSVLDRPVHTEDMQFEGAKRTGTMGMKLAPANQIGFLQILELKQAELIHILRVRDGIEIEKSADPMDEIQYATERDLAIRSADLVSNLLRDVRAALQRIRDGTFGTCVECESAISPKRLAALPWALRCIKCQDAADGDRHESRESFAETLESYV